MDPCTVISGLVASVAVPTVVALWNALQSERAAHRETLMAQLAADRRRLELLERMHLRASEGERP